MTLGPVMLDIAGTELDAEEKEILRQRAVGGVILFSRNHESPEQLTALTASIHGLRDPHLLVAVDQEGGRVQRLREGFTRLPPAGRFGALSNAHPTRARRAAGDLGWLMAAELRCVGIDFSFAPVLDLDRGLSRMIGDRAFAAGPYLVSDLAAAWVAGVHQAGMAAVGKHFPGQGNVVADSHDALPEDPRHFFDIERDDLVPFARLIHHHGLEAIMPAHVVYPRVDPDPVGFSPVWLRRVLRDRLHFQGVIFSDDLNMTTTAAGGGHVERARAALEAGCDVLLVRNNRPAALEVIESLRDHDDPTTHLRCLRMHGRGVFERGRLHLEPRWQQAMHAIDELAQTSTGTLDL